MYALDNNSGVVVMPEVKNQQFQPNAPRWFTEGGNGIAPSYPGADWFNIVQAELLNILTDAGMTPDKGKFNQITQAIRAIISSSVKTSLNDKASIASPIFTGTPKAPTPAQTVNDTTVATTAYVRAAIAELVGTAPATLDTLYEIANALAEGENVKATLLAEIAKKANISHTHTVSQITDFYQSVKEIVTQSITQGFTQSLAETGWCKLPNGLILQWGKFNKGHGFVSDEQRLVTFPITFPNKVLFVGLTEFTNGWSYSTTVENRQRMTNSGFYVISQRNDTMYFALGF